MDTTTHMDANAVLNVRTTRKSHTTALLNNDFIPTLQLIYYLEVIILYLLDRSFILLTLRAFSQTLLDSFPADYTYEIVLSMVRVDFSAPQTREVFDLLENMDFNSAITTSNNDNNNDNNDNTNSTDNTNNANNGTSNHLNSLFNGEDTGVTLPGLLQSESVKQSVERFCRSIALITILMLLLFNTICCVIHAFGSFPFLETPDSVHIISLKEISLSIIDRIRLPTSEEFKLFGDFMRNYLNSKTEFAIKSYEIKSNFLVDGLLINFIGELKRNTRVMFIILDLVVLVTQVVLYSCRFQDKSNHSYIPFTPAARSDSPTEETPLLSQDEYSNHTFNDTNDNANTNNNNNNNNDNDDINKLDDGFSGDIMLIDIPILPIITFKELKETFFGLFELQFF